MFDHAFATRAARVALANVSRAYPYQPSHVFASDADAVTPRALHPVFHGSYDWHSSVHMHWLLARVLLAQPAIAAAPQIVELFDRQFTPRLVAGECEYFARPHAAQFERTYGWAWLLALAQQLRALGAQAARWSAALAPLTGLVADRYARHLPRAGLPIRHGLHANSAFAMIFALDYARAAHVTTLETQVVESAVRDFGADRDAPARWEPSGTDFLSPVLIEAELMRRVLAPAAFSAWFDGFLPAFARSEPHALFVPAEVGDRGDPQWVHLDGLNLSRAWCFAGIERAFRGSARGDAANAAGARHLAAGLAGLESDAYVGEHWLASFAALALGGTAAE